MSVFKKVQKFSKFLSGKVYIPVVVGNAATYPTHLANPNKEISTQKDSYIYPTRNNFSGAKKNFFILSWKNFLRKKHFQIKKVSYN